MADWQAIKTEYLTTQTSYRKLAEKYGVDQATVARRAKKEDWVSKRQHHADKTQAKLLTADIDQKVDRVTRLLTVADRLLEKLEESMESDMRATSIKNYSDALKNIKDIQMIRSDADMAEQAARIEKLRREAQKEDHSREPVTVVLGEGLDIYSH